MGRLDETVLFDPLGPEQLAGIADRLLVELEQRAARQGYTLHHTPAAAKMLAGDKVPPYGARELRRKVSRAVEQALADRKKQEQALQNEASAKKKEMENLYKAIQAEEKKILAQANNYKAQIEKNKKLLDDIDKEIQKIIDSKSNNNGQYGGGTMFWPVPTVRNISSGFGSRWGTVHRGIDIANGSVPIYGEKIYAAESGTVIYSNYTSTWGGGYGYYCIVDHGLDSKGRRISTLYAHTSKMYARVGDKVTRGKTVLALAGDTGNVTGPHLHFEVRVNGVAVDPIKNGYVSLNK